MELKSKFERDRDVARELYPREMRRLELLRANFDVDFETALIFSIEEGHLIRWSDGTHILVYDAGASPISMRVRVDRKTRHIIDVGMGGPVSCPDLVEVRYDRKERPEADIWTETQKQNGYTKFAEKIYDPDAYWGDGNYYGDPPGIPPGGVRLSRYDR